MPVFQSKENISLKQNKVSTWMLFYGRNQSGFQVSVLPFYKNQAINMQFKSMGWLYIMPTQDGSGLRNRSFKQVEK